MLFWVIINNVDVLSHVAAKGDLFMNCIGSCSDPNDNVWCNNNCLKQIKNSGFCYPKLDGSSNEKDCCCYI